MPSQSAPAPRGRRPDFPDGERPGSRKAQIAAVAAELFCTRGYHNVGVDDIAETIGLTGPAIYRHFGTKHEILGQALQDLCDGLLEATEPDPSILDADSRLDDVLRRVTRFALDRRATCRLYQWDGRHLPESGQLDFAERSRPGIRAVRDLLQRCRPGLSRDEAGLLVTAALSVLASPATHQAKLSRAKAEAVLLEAAHAVLATERIPRPQRAPAEPPRPGGHLALLPRRERLLTEAVRLFHQHGYHAVSMADIGAAAGITASSVYRHFASKSSLLAAIYYRATDRLSAASTDAISGARDPADALDRLVDSYVRLTFDQADLASVYLSENENLPAEDRHALRVAQHRHVDTWVRLTNSHMATEPAATTRFRVHGALNVVTDLARLRVDASPDQAAFLVRAILKSQANVH